MKLPIYADYNATTPIDPRVLDVMLPYLRDHYGNPSSRSHALGRRAADAVSRAREQLAGAIGARPEQIFFTSGATESNNLALRGAVYRARRRRRNVHLITVATEHPAVLDCAQQLEHEGVSLTVLPVGSDGRVDPQAVADAITADTVIVSVMAVNNEVGTINALGEVGGLCRERGVPLHCDAVQAMGKIPLSVDALGADVVSLTAHKMYGPKGVGALYVRGRPRALLEPSSFGGGQEGGLRPGTLNVAGIVGLGQAAALLDDELAREAQRVARWRDRIEQTLRDDLGDIRVNGSLVHRIPGTLNASIAGVESGALLQALPDIALSSGSACASGSGSVSHVLAAMGVPEVAIHGAVRVSLGRFTTEDEVDYLCGRLLAEARRLRQSSPGYRTESRREP